MLLTNGNVIKIVMPNYSNLVVNIDTVYFMTYF